MTDRRQTFGRQSEALAVRHLKRQGYRIVAQNYRNRLGEIDIVAKDRSTLVFVEVKARRTPRFGPPKAAVTPQKQRKLSMVALAYLKETGQSEAAARFDVVAIDASAPQPVIEVVKNAFELAYP